MTLRELIKSVGWRLPGYMDAPLKLASSSTDVWEILSIYQDKATRTVWIDIEAIPQKRAKKVRKK